jgi:hypothetical protein
MNEVQKAGGNRLLVPPFLGRHTVSVGGEQRTLASFLAQPAAAEPDTKRLKAHAVVRDETFAQQIVQCQVVPILWNGGQADDPGVRSASLPPGVCWLTTNSSILFIRRCYDDLWSLINERYLSWINKTVVNAPQRLLLIGTTGIGKTVSMNFFLLRALQANYKVLFETRQKRYFFHDGIVESEKLDDRDLRDSARDDPTVFFLVDHEQKKEPPMVDAFTVPAVSPDRRTYKEFKKHDCFVLWMPLTTENELIAMNSIEWKLPNDKLRTRLDRYGPILRQVFLYDQVDAERELFTRINSFNYDVCLKQNIVMSSAVPEEFAGMSWWVLHVTTERNNYRVPGKIVWASRSIMQDVLDKFNQNRLGELEDIIADGLANPKRSHDVDGEFQYWACQRLASGGLDLPTFRATYVGGKCQYVPGSKLQIPLCHVELVQNLPAVAVMVQKRGVLLYSKLTNEPLCDAAMVLGSELLLFQMTIGEDHGFKLPTWKAYCKAAVDASLDRVRFLFVVPFRDKFRVTQEQIGYFQQDYGIEVKLEVVAIVPMTRQVRH